jgi:hypothetical protein
MSKFIIDLYYTKLYIVVECPVCFEEGNNIYSTNCGHVICDKCIAKLPSENKCYMCSHPLVKKNMSASQISTSSVPTVSVPTVSVSVPTRKIDMPSLYKKDCGTTMLLNNYKEKDNYIIEYFYF